MSSQDDAIKSTVPIGDTVEFTKTPAEGTIVDRSLPPIVGCESILSTVGGILSCMSLDHVDDSQEKKFQGDATSNGSCPGSPTDDTSSEMKAQRFQRRGRFLVWPACLGLDATLATTS